MAYGIVNGMEVRIGERLGFKPDTELVAIERVERRPSMAKVDGLWVHQGCAEQGANWDHIVEDVRAGRIESVLKA